MVMVLVLESAYIFRTIMINYLSKKYVKENTLLIVCYFSY
jgi:hypothetical protein